MFDKKLLVLQKKLIAVNSRQNIIDTDDDEAVLIKRMEKRNRPYKILYKTDVLDFWFGGRDDDDNINDMGGNCWVD
jgi:hypothetical protein